ncbi:TPA: autotransporter outer membrane beta-barrel domain-containing protein [Enterobacter cloacae subsp. dissolvens]
MKHTPLKKSAVALAVMSSLFAQAVVAEETTIDKPNTTLTGQTWTDRVVIQKEALGKDSVVTIKDSALLPGLFINATMDGGTLNISGSTFSPPDTPRTSGLVLDGNGGSVSVSDSVIFSGYLKVDATNATVSVTNSRMEYGVGVNGENSKASITDSVVSSVATEGNNSHITVSNSLVTTLSKDVSAKLLARSATSALTLNNSQIEAYLDKEHSGTLTLNNSRWTGAWDGKGAGTVALNAGSAWNVTGESAKPDGGLGTLAVSDSALILAAANVRAKALSGSNALIHSTFDEAKGAFRTLTTDKAEGDFRVALASTGKNISAAEQAALAAPVVVVKDGDSTATFSGSSDLGTWAYDAVARTAEAGGTEVGLVRTDRVSTGAGAAVNMASSAVNTWNTEDRTLDQRMGATRHAPRDQGGVWGAYYGGRSDVSTRAGTDYTQNTRGFMLGTDTELGARNGTWLAGVALSRGDATVDMTGAKGKVQDTGVQVYLSRRYDSGAFVDTAARIARFSGNHNVTSSDGAKSDASWTANGFGASMKGGYTWKHDVLFVEPYLKAGVMTLEGMDYTTSNGMTVSSEGFTSLRGEAGVDIGADMPFRAGTVSPFLRLAGAKELSDNNSLTINGDRVNASTDGAAFTGGAGVRVALDAGPGLWAGVDYANGRSTESPWLLNAGVSFTW